MTVYGGPGRQTVMDEWEYTSLWHQHIANLGYIVVSVDNRGTDGKGSDFRRATYGQMGKLETIDQIETAKHLMYRPPQRRNSESRGTSGCCFLQNQYQ